MILLDTHMLMALLGQADLVLKPAMTDVLHGNTNKFVSVVTIWEMAIKHRLGKLHLAFSLPDLPDILAKIEIGLLNITTAHTLAAIGPEPITKDPFDRLLLGVCATEAMRLLTIDRALADHPLAWR